MDDVLRHLVFGTRNPHLGSEQPVGAVVTRFGPGRDIGQRRSGRGLRQRHGAGEPARQHRLDERLDLLAGAELGEQIGVGDSQHQIARRADIGSRQPREAGLGDGRRQLRTAQGVVHTHAQQARGRDGVEGLLHLGDHGDRGSVERRLVLIALLVVRCEVAGGQFLEQVEHIGEGFAGVLGEPGPLRQFVDVQPLEEQEIEIPPGHHCRPHCRPLSCQTSR